MIETALRVALAYLTYVRPVMYGAHLCKKENPNPTHVTNITLALIFGWLMEVADAMFFSSLIAARSLWLFVRIVLCLYFCHPTFLGALNLYEKVLGRLIDAYGPMVDTLLVHHIDAIANTGIVHYSTTVVMSLFRVVMEVVDIARRLMESTTTTEVPAASLPRRLSVGRSEPVYDGRGGGAAARPEDQYVTASVVAKVRRAASSASPPPQEGAHHAAGFMRAEGFTIEARQLRPPLPSPPPEACRAQHFHQGDYFDEDEEVEYSNGSESGTGSGSSTPPAVHRRAPTHQQRRQDYYFGGDDGI